MRFFMATGGQFKGHASVNKNGKTIEYDVASL